MVESFRKQLEAFRAVGYHFVNLEEALGFLGAGDLDKPIMTVTFDDGYRSIYENAVPVLNDLGIKAFLYVTADYIHKGFAYRNETTSPVMSWQQLRELVEQGYGIGSHTLTHAPLRLCNSARLMQECALSKRILEDNLQIPIRHLSYPWGQHSRRTRVFLSSNGLYQSAATIDRGSMYPKHDPYKLRRDLCDPMISVKSMLRLMRMADYFYWLRYLRKKPEGYWKRHPEEKWSALEDFEE